MYTSLAQLISKRKRSAVFIIWTTFPSERFASDFRKKKNGGRKIDTRTVCFLTDRFRRKSRLRGRERGGGEEEADATVYILATVCSLYSLGPKRPGAEEAKIYHVVGRHTILLRRGRHRAAFTN